MKSHSNLLAIVTAGLLGLSAAAQADGFGHGGGYRSDTLQHRFERQVDRRQVRQWDRIQDGIDSGELSRGESRRLIRDQRRIARMEKRFERDGYYSPRERRTLERALDRTSQRIKRAKHNDRRVHGYDRGWHGGHHRHDAGSYAYEWADDAYASGSSPGVLSFQVADVTVTWSPAYQD